MKIGRIKLNDVNEVQNDIVISLVDLSISRYHCKINYFQGFNYNRQLPDNLLSLLMLNHRRLGRDTNLPNLPTNLLFNIYSYLDWKRQFYIIDCGSVYGTYVKMRHGVNNVLTKGQMFCMGNEYLLTVLDICQESDFYDEYIFKAYIKHCNRHGTEIVGLNFDFDFRDDYENDYPDEISESIYFSSQMYVTYT